MVYRAIKCSCQVEGGIKLKSRKVKYNSSLTTQVIIRLMQRAPIRTLSYIPRLASFRPIHTTISRMSASASVTNPSTLAEPLNKTAHAFDKGQLDAMLSRRFFYAPAFEIYGGG